MGNRAGSTPASGTKALLKRRAFFVLRKRSQTFLVCSASGTKSAEEKKGFFRFVKAESNFFGLLGFGYKKR